MKTPITAVVDMDLKDTTLLNTNHNSNYFGQTSHYGSSSMNQALNSTQILKANGTTISTYSPVPVDNRVSLEARGVNAVHRRAEQLKRWQEAEEEHKPVRQDNLLDSRSRLINKTNMIYKKCDNTARRIKFSNSTLFLAACASSDYDEINRLLDNDLVDINVGNIDGLTALHHACIDDNAELVEFLLKKGADVNCVDNEGWSPLHSTVACDHLEIARLLLIYGADCTLVNVDHELALDLGDNRMYKLIEDALYEQQIVRDVRDFDRLRRQEEEKMREDVVEMIKTGIYDNKIHERTGATILHVAACKGYLDILQMLFENKILKKQIDVNVKDNEGWTPLCAATYWNKTLIVELLFQNGADVNCVTNNNQVLEQMTDYDLILNLIAIRREQLKKKQESLRLQEENKENGNLNKSNAESETQRKAHAKRIRESRRSTQGISAEDVNKAKDQLLFDSSKNSTVINLSGNHYDSTSVTSNDPNEIMKLDTISEINVNEESIQSSCQPSGDSVVSLHKTSQSDNCEIVEIKSVLDYVDGQSGKQHTIREFTRPYRPKITIDESEDIAVDQELNATIRLNANDILNTNDQDELKNDVVLNLRRDSLNILHQRKDVKKTAATGHRKDNSNLMYVELLDDHQSPSTQNTNDSIASDAITLDTNHQKNNQLNEDSTNRETSSTYTVRRDISQDSLEDQTNIVHNDCIGINSTLNSSLAVNYSVIEPSQSGISKNTVSPVTNLITNDQSNEIKYSNYNSSNIVNKPQFDPGETNVDQESRKKISFNEQQFKQPAIANNLSRINQTNDQNAFYSHPSMKQTMSTVKPQFEVPVLIETPCTPEPVDNEDQCSSADSVTTTATITNNSFETEIENNVTKRKRQKKRIENQEEIDSLYNETMNTIDPKYTRDMEPSRLNNQINDKTTFLFNNCNLSSSNVSTISNASKQQSGNALKLYNKVDNHSKLPNSPISRSRPTSETNYKIKNHESDKQTSASSKNDTTENESSSTQTTLHSANFKQPLLSHSTNYQPTIVNQQTIDSQQSAVQGSVNASTCSLDNERSILDFDYKKMYEELLLEFESFKAEASKKEQDYLRDKRKMERKISELEEELLQMTSVKEDNTRLKNENGALVRVISKLSK